MKTKNILPIIFAGLAALVAFVVLKAQKEQTIDVVIASRHLPTGHTLNSDDLAIITIPDSSAPEWGVTDPASLIGGTLRVERYPNDYIGPQHLGGQNLELAPDERALAIEVTDSAGLGGLLKPGDVVGVTAVMADNLGTYAKVVAENLRVLYVAPEFKAVDPAAYQPSTKGDESGFSSSAASPNRQTRGVVVLAVPTGNQIVAYDFASFGVESETRLVNIVDLLPALDHAHNVELSLFIQPLEANTLLTSGVFVPDLMVVPGPSPTPTTTPIGFEGEATPQPGGGSDGN